MAYFLRSVNIFISMREVIKRLLRESLDNLGYRAGDLNIKAEPKSNMAHSNRHTGHFGTVFYFFGNRNSAEDYAKKTGDRDVNVIDVSGYNLAKGTNKLHDMLKGVNDSYFSNDDRSLQFNIERLLKDYGKLKPRRSEFGHIRKSSDYNNLSGDEMSRYDDEMDYNLRVDSENNKMIDKVIELMHANNDDSPSTVLMKYMGFDGVDSRSTKLDNATYGSVLYDIY